VIIRLRAVFTVVYAEFAVYIYIHL
jgi:hypothetical protein